MTEQQKVGKCYPILDKAELHLMTEEGEEGDGADGEGAAAGKKAAKANRMRKMRRRF